jgi:8-amino-7-oxononanoate synthase
MAYLNERLKTALEARARDGALRSLPPDTQEVDFSSNDYLGLARLTLPRDTNAGIRSGSTGSRLISGNHPLAERLESELAAFHQAESALLFSSGYMANLGVLSSVPKRGDTILYDQLIHASLRDGIRLSHARAFSFRHNDLDQLEERMKKAAGQIFIVTESIFSMDGDEAPLTPLCALAEKYQAALVVDEAHATGVFGPRGEGIVVEKGLADRVWCRIHTFGKAVGGHGAAVLGPEALKPFLINFARPFIYTTALPPQQWVHIREAYQRIGRGAERRAMLFRCIELFTRLLPINARAGWVPARGPIQSLIIGGNEQTKQLATHLNRAGLGVKAILAPTVPRGTERIRITLHSYNSDDEIRKLIECLDQYFNDREAAEKRASSSESAF